MSGNTKALVTNARGRVKLTNACNAIRHQLLTIGGSDVELKVTDNPLRVRRVLMVRPRDSATNPNAWIAIGPAGFSLEKGTPVWRGYELILEIGENNKLFARRGSADFGSMLVSIIELGEA